MTTGLVLARASLDALHERVTANLPERPPALRDLRLGDLADALAERSVNEWPPARYVNLRQTNLYRPALAAIRRGELRAYRPAGSRKFLVTVEDWHAWIERSEHRVSPSAPRRPGAEVDAANKHRRTSKQAAGGPR